MQPGSIICWCGEQDCISRTVLLGGHRVFQRAASHRQACEACRRTVPNPTHATPRERAPRQVGTGQVIAEVRRIVKNKE